MPNLAICCPHCGSSDCNEYRANAFVCRHCDTTFRWTNPGERTLLHKPAHCDCGKNSMGVCTRCERPVCRSHHVTWRAICAAWSWFDFTSAAPRAGWFSQSSLATWTNEIVRDPRDVSLVESPSDDVVAQILSAVGLAGREADLLCFDCAEAAVPELLKAVRSRNAKLRGCGGLCGLCEHERLHEKNAFCSIYVAAAHRCQDCGQPVCWMHHVACKKCGHSFCKAHAPRTPDGLCQPCRPWLVTRALKAVITAL